MRWKVAGIVAALPLMSIMLAAYAFPSSIPAGTTQAAVKGKTPAAGKGAASSSQNTITVLNPQGPVKKNHELAPRLGSLDGKKIAMWLSSTPDEKYAGKGAELYGLLEQMLKEKYPGIKIVSHKELPMKFAPEKEVLAAITAVQPDAVVAGFGG